MRVYLVIFIFIFSCTTSKKIDVVETPKETKFDSYRRVIPTTGKENSNKMKYYNSLQHKKFYSKKIPSK